MARLNTALLPQRQLIEAIPVEVRRSKRRRTRIGLSFDPGGYVIAEAPLDATAAEIRTVIRENAPWLRHRLEKVNGSIGLSSCVSYTSGELMHYLGEPYELVVRSGERDQVQRRERPVSPGQLQLYSRCSVRGCIHVTLRAPDAALGGCSHRVKQLLVEWYRDQAGEQFAGQLEAWRRTLPWLRDRMPPWRHRFMRSQWGSCSLSGRISLNTHLVKAPPRLTEYVVLHELCHLQHYDHGKRFYGLMSRFMPDWEQRRGELDHYLPVLLQD
ncbi:MAG: M48 family metallopeptidase [Pseudomonadales bacterium]